MSLRILPLPTPLAEQARRTRRAPGFGHPVQPSIAGRDGYGPCRHCLRRTREGEGRLLLTYNPYPEPGEVPVAGPIFIHEAPCAAWSEPGFPEELRGLPLVIQAHLAGGAGLRNHPVGDDDPERILAEVLADPGIAFATLRNAEAGCFIARAERA